VGVATSGGSSAAGGSVGVATSGGSSATGGAAEVALEDGSCSVVWGDPGNDPGYRGLRGTASGEPLTVDADHALGSLAVVFADGPGPTPEFGVYFGASNLSFGWGSGCVGSVTSPTDTQDHPLDISLSAFVERPTTDAQGYPMVVPERPRASGQVRLRGASQDGPVDILAHFYLDTTVSDPTAPPVK
jgi:hypothetical protein